MVTSFADVYVVDIQGVKPERREISRVANLAFFDCFQVNKQPVTTVKEIRNFNQKFELLEVKFNLKEPKKPAGTEKIVPQHQLDTPQLKIIKNSVRVTTKVYRIPYLPFTTVSDCWFVVTAFPQVPLPRKKARVFTRFFRVFFAKNFPVKRAKKRKNDPHLAHVLQRDRVKQ